MEYNCQKCGAAYQVDEPGYYKCAQCGEVFTVDAPANITPAAQCPMCKGVIPPDAKKCQHCGSWVKPKPPSVLVYNLLWLFTPTALIGAPEVYAGRTVAGVCVLLLSIVFFFLFCVKEINPAFFLFVPCVYLLFYRYGLYSLQKKLES